MPKRNHPTVFVVSDGRGDTGTQLVKAAVVQFEEQPYDLVRRSSVRSASEVEEIVEEAAKTNGVIFYTLVTKETRQVMRRTARARLVRTVDILGPAFTALHDLFQKERGSRPGLLYDLERERLDRMEAIDYTLKHDDGQRPHELSAADVVLVGVSRASKSSTCFFLAYEGVRAANVPLLPDIPPPPQLLRLPREKVIGLRVTVTRLLTIREARARDLGLRDEDVYLDERSVTREVLAANRTMERNGWHSIDASYLAIEEIAKEVIRLRGLSAVVPF